MTTRSARHARSLSSARSGSPTFFTIGHSTRPLADLINLLRSADVELLVDVRSIPRSRTNPQFNSDALPAALAPAGLAYRHLEALGGLRGRAHGGAPSPNDFWQNTSFRNYADYAASAAFRAGLTTLLELGERQRSALMCAEAVWWRCHRRIIADYLLLRGCSVVHIMGAGRLEPAQLTPAARALADGTLVYPATSP